MIARRTLFRAATCMAAAAALSAVTACAESPTVPLTPMANGGRYVPGTGSCFDVWFQDTCFDGTTSSAPAQQGGVHR